MPPAETQQLAFFQRYDSYQPPPPRKSYAVLVLAVALVVVPWSLLAWFIWTMA